MSTVSQVKKLKITVTNIKSVLMKRTKRLANLKKINDRDTRNLFSSQKRGAAEKKLESPLKKMRSGISNISQAATGINVGGIFDALKLLGLGIVANAVFENLDEIKENAEKLKKKVDSWMGNNKGKMDEVEKGLDKIDTDELKKMTDKFFNQSEKLDEKLENSNTKQYSPDTNNIEKMITVTEEESFEMLNDTKKGKRGGLGLANPNFKEENFYGQPMQPIKKDTNLSSLLNSNGSKVSVILARQNIIYEA
tara:strand:- start:20 stop:772 length:753 start_codon:yes stop_codon:yes gene_type:complete